MGYIVGPLISVPAQNSATWTQRTADISAYIGQNVRLVVLYQSGSSFTGDVQLDDFNIGGNTFDPETGTHSFQVQSVEDNSQLSNVNYIQSDYDSVTWSSLTTDGSTHATGKYGKFFRDSGGTPSGSTGNTSGNTGSFYYFAETSSTGSNNDIWIRSPEVTVNNGTLSFYTAQNGATSGPIYAYIEVTSVPAKAVYGLGRYGDSNYGKLPETVRAPLSVSKVGSIYGQQNYGGTTYGSGSISTTHSGISATGSVTTVTVTADSSVTLPSVSATGSVTTVTVSADGVGNVNVGTAATNNLSPEFGLTLDHVFSEADMSGTTISNGGLNNDYNGNFPGTGQNTVLAFETTLPSSFSASFDGFLTIGGTGAGTWAGVYNDSGTYKYWVSAGEGGTGSGFGSIGDAAADEEAISNIPEFDGGTHTVVIEIRINPGRIRSFIDGRLVLEGNTTGGGALEANIYAGSFREAFGSWGPVRDVSGTGDWSGTIQSDLRVYTGELADFGTTLTLTADANVSITGVSATGTVNDSLTFTGDSTLTTPSVSATATPDADLVIEADARHTVTSVQGVSGVTSVGTVGVAIHEVTGVEGVGRVTSSTVSGDNNTVPSGVSGTGQNTTVTVSGDSNASVLRTTGTGKVTTATVFANSVTTVPSVSATGSVTTVGVSIPKTVVVPSVTATGSTTTVTIFTGEQEFVDVPSVEATGAVNTGDNIVATLVDVVVPSVSATGTVNDSLTFVAEANLTLASVQATGVIDDLTFVAEANTTSPSVQATATVDPDVIIEGDALHVITSVQGVTATGGVGDVVAGADIDTLTGVEATGQVATATTSGSANTTPDSTQGTGQTSTVIISGVANFALNGVEATTTVDTVDISLPRVVALDSVSTTAFVDTATVSADSNLASPSVSATATVDPDIVIEGDALHVITSVQGVSASGGIGDVVAEANLDTITGVEATGSIGTVEVAAPRDVAVSGVQATGNVTTVTVTADNVVVVDFVTGTLSNTVPTISGDANFVLSSASLTATVTTPAVSADSNTSVTSVSATTAVNSTTTSAVIFDYNAQKNNYSKKRTVYLPRVA